MDKTAQKKKTEKDYSYLESCVNDKLVSDDLKYETVVHEVFRDTDLQEKDDLILQEGENE